MKIKIDYLKKIAREIDLHNTSISSLMDKYDVVAEENDIRDLVETLRCFAELVENIPIA